MDVDKLGCKGFIQGKKRFIIPIYQRHYNWHVQQCKQLFNDLKHLIESSQNDTSVTHFFGSIFAMRKDEGVDTNVYILIDGQQRITSIFLFYLAMYNAIQSQQIIISDEASKIELIDEIYNDILVDRHHPENHHLLLGENDIDDFNHLFQLKSEEQDNYRYKNPNICNNYRYFYSQLINLSKSGFSIEKLSEAIARLRIVLILLDEKEKPQQIFESLNSTGLALSECDKIRNFVFMDMSFDEQRRAYNTYWREIERNVGNEIEKLNEFFSDYLSIMIQKQPKRDEIYLDYKKYVLSIKNNEEILIDILCYARLYKILCDYTKDTSIVIGTPGSVYRLEKLQITTPRPLILKLLRLQHDGKLKKEEVSEFLGIIENYIFRRFVCSLPTNSLKNVFLSLLKDLSDDNASIEKLKYKLLAKNSDDKSRFPSDDEFVEAFANIDFYLLDLKIVQYALERINNFDTNEAHPVWEGFDRDTGDGSYSIEHIMPQTLNRKWKDQLGDNWKAVHDEWVNRIANLTITGYNQEYSNKEFGIKRNCRHGFKNSGLRINNWIGTQEKWGLDELEARNEKLKKLALEIWAKPSSVYKPDVKSPETCSLNEVNANDLVGRDIFKFSYKDEEYSVTTWAKMYVQVLKMLHMQDKSVLINIANAPNYEDSSYGISYEMNYLTAPKLVDEEEGIYVDTNTTTPKKIDLLLKFFKLYNANPSELVFYLRNKREGQS